MDGLATERVLRPRPFARRRVDGFGSQDFGESIYKLPSISNTFWNGYNKGIPMAKRKRKSKKMKPAEQPHGVYSKLHRVNREQFSRLCAMMDWLYVFCDEDFDKLAEYVGLADSIHEFEQQTKSLIDSTVANRNVFVERAAQMWRAKEEWRDTTARLAREVLPLYR